MPLNGNLLYLRQLKLFFVIFNAKFNTKAVKIGKISSHIRLRSIKKIKVAVKIQIIYKLELSP
ncbi:hypothetical protein DP113_31220 [Brasilonema octagenarum UFV-E1]|uniref:Uncharacterized protein n=2 Tax=Brasilonema TaxID=383614 RepID=A0A856MM45_9CYAN|nr:hypothetical protein [Brasilonema octagenarum UFV-OR1]QDL11748.1 hypothetical protein DP114_31080 [Brasilonema sennae CENA114]QDL18128.1 hypothetical protein DP113_31220 [Brasilonema octagenarum UFV-E1]